MQLRETVHSTSCEIDRFRLDSCYWYKLIRIVTFDKMKRTKASCDILVLFLEQHYAQDTERRRTKSVTQKTEEMSITDSTKNKNTGWNNWEKNTTSCEIDRFRLDSCYWYKLIRIVTFDKMKRTKASCDILVLFLELSTLNTLYVTQKTEEMSITDSTKNKNTGWNNWEKKETKIIRYPYSWLPQIHFKLMLFLQLYAIGYWFYLDFLFTDKDTLDVYCNGVFVLCLVHSVASVSVLAIIDISFGFLWCLFSKKNINDL
jgi:uncharacterized protein Smg (DUF494 family)